jgi:hypothetical protein
MYTNPPNPTTADFLAGQLAYHALDMTVQLTQLMRQDGENEETILFCQALSELRECNVSGTYGRPDRTQKVERNTKHTGSEGCQKRSIMLVFKTITWESQ